MPGEVIGLIGNNGDLKSTLLNAIGGLCARQGAGAVPRAGRRPGQKAHRRCGIAGWADLPSRAGLYPELTVRDYPCNWRSAARLRRRSGGSLLWVPSIRPGNARSRGSRPSFIDFLGLGRYADRYIAELSTGTP